MTCEKVIQQPAAICVIVDVLSSDFVSYPHDHRPVTCICDVLQCSVMKMSAQFMYTHVTFLLHIGDCHM